MSQSWIQIGFGSQGKAWAESFKARDWDVEVFQRSRLPKLREHLIARSKQSDAAIAIGLLIPDHLIGPVYTEYLADLDLPLDLVVAHGYCVACGTLKLQSPKHRAVLFAPKAIGPKLQEAALKLGSPHSLTAAVSELSSLTHALGEGLGFKSQNLVVSSFETETRSDWISEQGLLCGGLFTLFEWTIRAMRDAGVPEPLIHAECFTELRLFAELLETQGLAKTFARISPAAKAGTIAMQDVLEASRTRFLELARQSTDLSFARFAESEPSWKAQADALMDRLQTADRFSGRPS